jgi:AraC-like DNA-binding protein
MPMLSDTITLVNFVGAIQGIFLVIVLLTRKTAKSHANKLLAITLLCFSIYTLGTILKCTRFILAVPHFAGTYPVLLFALGPLIFLYIQSLATTTFTFQWKHILHFVPLFCRILYAVPLYIKSEEYKLDYLLKSYTASSSLDSWIILAIAFIQTLVYLILSCIVLIRYAKSDCLIRSERKYFLGIHYIMVGLLSLWVVWILGYVYPVSLVKILAPLLFSLLVYSLAYWTITHPYVLLGISLNELHRPSKKYASIISHNNRPVREVDAEKKYFKSGLQEDTKIEYLNRLTELMEKEKLYRNGELTLAGLADKLAVTTNHISQVINEHLHQSFHDFVNGYRIKEIKKELSNPAKKHLTILAIGLDAGFNSKNAFNTAFKKHTGYTPSEYKKYHDHNMNVPDSQFSMEEKRY